MHLQYSWLSESGKLLGTWLTVEVLVCIFTVIISHSKAIWMVKEISNGAIFVKKKENNDKIREITRSVPPEKHGSKYNMATLKDTEGIQNRKKKHPKKWKLQH